MSPIVVSTPNCSTTCSFIGGSVVITDLQPNTESVTRISNVNDFFDLLMTFSRELLFIH